MTPGSHVGNMPEDRRTMFVENLAHAAIRLGVDLDTESVEVNEKTIVFSTACGRVSGWMYPYWTSRYGAADLNADMARMTHDMTAVRRLGRSVVQASCFIERRVVRAILLLGGTTDQVREAILAAGPHGVDHEVRLGFGPVEIGLTASWSYNVNVYRISSFALPGIATARMHHSEMEITTARKLTDDEIAVVGLGGGLRKVLGHDLFDVHPFAVTAVEQRRNTTTFKVRMRDDMPRVRVDAQGRDVEEMSDGEGGIVAVMPIVPVTGERADTGTTGIDMEAAVMAARTAFVAMTLKDESPWEAVVEAVLRITGRDITARPVRMTIDPAVPAWHAIPVEHLKLDTRARNCVLSTDAETIGDLVAKRDAELVRIPNFGRKSLVEVRAAIADVAARA